MGDHFQTVIDVEATQEEAERLAPRLVDWLVEQGIVTRELTRDGMYSMGTDVGHLPGPHWARAVSDASDEPDAPGPVAVIVGRNQYCGGQGASEAVSAVCPRCAREIRFIDYQSLVHAVDEDAWRPFCQGIEAWRATGHAGVSCPSCVKPIPMTEWLWAPGFALGSLAVDFWNWPRLSREFVAEAERQTGHRIEELTGKF
ncbi:hypothetical protein OG204_06110 [Streptomyces sp. NBC_01387]|uniref:hypothetical protein n=1 Tax=unclassified Streptomyces TaxID=2593676 RepID=UPI0020241819|nr:MULTISPECIES: hypothetical protein [unclassified Streptomyces]WSC23517.1 hypothetical protein OIE60_29740 [Streptomyces sp. NBC_01766]WSV57390.1 hypothetical protein OG282_28940 [Streptomyces sp. NBC_01014]